MFRANRPRGEDSPAVPRDGDTTPTSIEGLLALSLCALVILASMALLRRSSAYSRVLSELQGESLRKRARKPRTDGSASSQARPDLVILVSLDTLRADRLDLYGYGRETAPHLRELGEGGVVFRTVCA